MSNRRSFILLVALVTIASYLYYKSGLETVQQILKIEDLSDSKTERKNIIIKNIKQSSNISSSRHLLFFDGELDSRDHDGTQMIKNIFPLENFAKVNPDKNKTFYWNFIINNAVFQNNLTLFKPTDKKFGNMNKARNMWMKLSIYESENGPKSNISMSVDRLVEKISGNATLEKIIVDTFRNSIAKNKIKSTTGKKQFKRSEVSTLKFSENKENSVLVSGKEEAKNKAYTDKNTELTVSDTVLPSQLNYKNFSETPLCINCTLNNKSDILRLKNDIQTLSKISNLTINNTKKNCLNFLLNFQKSSLMKDLLEENSVENSTETFNNTDLTEKSNSFNWLHSILKRFIKTNSSQTTNKLIGNKNTKKENFTEFLPNVFSIKNCRNYLLQTNNISETVENINQIISLLPFPREAPKVSEVSDINNSSSQAVKLFKFKSLFPDKIPIREHSSENYKDLTQLSTRSINDLYILNDTNFDKAIKENFNVHLTRTLKSEGTKPLDVLYKSGRGFKDSNVELDMLELGSSDEYQVFESKFVSSESKMKETIEKEFILETVSEQSFLPSDFSFSSGFRELVDNNLSNEDTLNKNSNKISEKIGSSTVFNFGSGSGEIKETVWSEKLESDTIGSGEELKTDMKEFILKTTLKERFSSSFFNFGSGFGDMTFGSGFGDMTFGSGVGDMRFGSGSD